MGSSRTRRVLTSTLFVLATLNLALVGWSAWQIGHRPYFGMDWNYSTGEVVRVDSVGPASGVLQPGDHVVALTDVPIAHAVSIGEHLSQQQVAFRFLRDATVRSVELRASRPPLAIVVLDQVPTLVALIYCALSAVLLALKPSGWQSNLGFLFFQVFSAALSVGALAAAGFDRGWTTTVYRVLVWWVGPLALHFHLHFPSSIRLRYRRLGLGMLYGVTIAGSALLIVRHWLELPALGGSLNLFWLTACLLGVVALLVWGYRRSALRMVRREIGLVAIGAWAALLPFIVLLLLPYALTGGKIVPQSLPFLMMLAIPGIYGYAIINYRLIRLNRHISRTAAYTFTTMLLISIYVIVQLAMTRLLPPALLSSATTNLAIILLLALTAHPLYRWLRRGVDHLCYGGSYDYRSAVHLVSQTLGHTANDAALAQSLCESICTAMQLEEVRLFLRDQSDALVLCGYAADVDGEVAEVTHLPRTSPLVEYLQRSAQPIDRAELRAALARTDLSEAEDVLLRSATTRLWIPLSTPDGLIGVCVLGSQRGSEAFDVIDLDILQVVTRLANTSIQNTQLIAALRRRAAESEQLHQQVVRSREEERKRVARELHDQIIQSLVVLNYHLSEWRAQPAADIVAYVARLQTDVRNTLDDVRRICADLRPPVLDNLGLVPAVRSRLRDLERQGELNVVLELDGDAQQAIPEDVALCVYRVMQEALVNVQKHSGATTVVVDLAMRPNEVCLTVRDDGKGFDVPPQLGQLMTDQHFGLVGLRERLELVHGALKIHSKLGQGTSISAIVPLPLAAPAVDTQEEGLT